MQKKTNLIEVGCSLFYQTYSVLLLGNKKSSSYYLSRKGVACFGDVFIHINRTKETDSKIKAAKLRVLIGIDPKINTTDNHDNFCVLSRDEIYQWLNELTYFFSDHSLSYKVSEKKVGERNFIEVIIKIYNLHAYYIKWLLTYIRLLSEQPCSWVLREAFTLKQTVEDFKELPLLSVFMFIWSFLRGYHAFSAGSLTPMYFEPLSFDAIKKALEEKPKNNCGVDKWFEDSFRGKRRPIDLQSYSTKILERFISKELVNKEVLEGIIPKSTFEAYQELLKIIQNKKKEE